jgi:multidrug efflux system outer membrane protein
MKGSVLCFSLIGIMLSGCAVGPIYQVPDIDVPVEWHTEVPATVETTCFNETPWWESLADPILNSLMSYAVLQNLDLQIAATRVLMARREVTAKKADLYPHIDGSMAPGHLYYSKDALVNGLLGNVCPKKSHVKRNINFFELGFDAEWELDLFGHTAHEIAASKAHAEASENALCSAWVTLSAEIAKNYIQLRGLQHKLHIAKSAVDAQREMMELTEELVGRGLLTQSDESLAKAEWSTLKAVSPMIEFDIARTIYRLSILLGYNPGDLCDYLSCLSPLPCLPDQNPIGIPSELLRRRPDIQKAERDLAAATERVGAAVASLYPKLSLRGFIGDIATSTSKLFSPTSTTWLAGPLLLAPIFNSRLLQQDVDYSKLATREALYTYQKTILDALEEAESGIAAFKAQNERFQLITEAHQHSISAWKYAQDLYARGLEDNFAVIKAQKSMLTTKESCIQTKVDLLMSYVALYKALGGSWGCMENN